MYRFTGFTEKANNAMNRAIEKAEELGHNYIGSEHVLYGLIAEGSGVAFNVLNKLGITADDYERLMQEKIGASSPTNLTTAYFTPRTKRILQMAKLAASKLGSNYVGTEHLLIAIIEDGESFAMRFLQMLGVDPQSVANALSSALSDGYTVDKASGNAYPKDENGEKEGGSALEKFGRDLTKLAAEGKIDPVIGRHNEIERVIQILSRRTKNNPVLIGEPGVGKTAVAEALAQALSDVHDGLYAAALRLGRCVGFELETIAFYLSTLSLAVTASSAPGSLPKQLLAIARAGAGVNNIPVDRCSEEGIVVFNTPGANANAVKELVLCGLMLA